jgi:hypothetical protein
MITKKNKMMIKILVLYYKGVIDSRARDILLSQLDNCVIGDQDWKLLSEMVKHMKLMSNYNQFIREQLGDIGLPMGSC